MSVKHRKVQLFTLCVIVPIGSMVLSVSGITPSKGSAPAVNSRTERNTRGDSQVAASMVGEEFQISLPTTPESDRFKPRIAYNSIHNEYLIIWFNIWPSGHRDIYARRVSATGQLLSWFSVSAGTNDRTDPAVAYNAINDEYLIVWMYNANGDGTTFEIWGRTVAWNGATMDPEFQIITWTNRTFLKPEVVWNQIENEYLVVWSAFDATTLQATDVAYAMLDSDGNKFSTIIISSSDKPHQADVTYNSSTDEYFVVWRYMNSSQGDIRGARINASTGLVVNPPGEIDISSESWDEQFPSVTTNGEDRILVGWQSKMTTWDIHGNELDSDGNLLPDGFWFISSGSDDLIPEVAARPGLGRDYLLSWQRSTASDDYISVSHWGDIPFKVIKVVTNSSLYYERPVAAWGKVGAMFVYEGYLPTVGTYRHIYGSQWAPYAVYMPVEIR